MIPVVPGSSWGPAAPLPLQSMGWSRNWWELAATLGRSGVTTMRRTLPQAPSPSVVLVSTAHGDNALAGEMCPWEPGQGVDPFLHM